MKYKELILSFCILSSNALRAEDMAEPELDGLDFEKRFTASYGILSDKEPEISEIESAVLQKLAPMMRVNKEYAKKMLEGMLAGEQPASATFNYLLGNVYFEYDEYFLAEKEYKAAIEKFPDFQRAWTNLGVLKLRSDDTRGALRAFLKAVELGDYSSQTFGMLGYCHFSEGNFMSADVAYNRAILSDPGNLGWLEGKAKIYIEAERDTEAIKMLDELISHNPLYSGYWKAQSNAYLASKDLMHTARNLEIIHMLGNADFDSYHLLGKLYLTLGLFDRSVETFLAAHNLTDTPPASLSLKAASLLFYNAQKAHSRKLFKEIDLDSSEFDSSEKVEYAQLKAEFALVDNDHKKAISLFERVIEMDPLNGKSLIRLANLHVDYGSKDKAFLLAERAENDPKYKYDALLLRSKLLIESRRFSEALVSLGVAMQLKSSDSILNLYDRVKQAAEDSK